MIWTTREGQRINIRDMTDSHLQNTIRWLRNRASEGENAYWGAGMALQGDEAVAAWEDAMDALIEKSAQMRAIADDMETELARRQPLAEGLARRKRATPESGPKSLRNLWSER